MKEKTSPLKVYKYPIPRAHVVCEVMLPSGAKILHGDWQLCSGLCIWAQVDPDAPPARRRVIFAGSWGDEEFTGTGGDDVPAGSRFINTFLMQKLYLVFHVFEV